MKGISWLHLSDLHLKIGDAYNQSRLLTTLFTDIDEQITSLSLRLDFVVFTGDLAFSGRPEEYEIAGRFFDDLLARVALNRNRLFVVPGNHDINRGLLPTPRQPIIDGWPSRDAINNLLFGEHREESLTGLRSYFDFSRRYFGDNSSNETGFYCRSLDLDTQRVAILGLNSAFASRGDDDRNKLFIGERQVVEALEQSGTADIRVALVHHPLDWLHETDRYDVEALLLDRCDFLLHGHIHRSSLQRLSTPDSSAMVIMAGALYQGRALPNVYSIVSLDMAGRTGEVRLRRYSDERGGFWSPDTMTYRNVRDGRCRFEWPLAPLLPGVEGDSRRLVDRYPKALRYALNEERRGIRSVENLLVPEDDPQGIDIVWRSPRLREDVRLRVRSGVKAGELAIALAREHFPQEFVGNNWHLSGADFEWHDSNRRIQELASQGQTLVYLVSVPVEAGRLHSPAGDFQVWSAVRIRKLAETNPACLMLSRRFILLRNAMTIHGPSIAGRLRLAALRAVLSMMWRSLNNFGWACGEAGNLASGVQILEAMEGIPGLRRSAECADTMAWLYYRQGRFWKARRTILDALERTPTWKSLWICHLYFILRACGDTTLAAEVRNAFLAQPSGDDELTALAFRRLALKDDCLEPGLQKQPSGRDATHQGEPSVRIDSPRYL